MKKEHLFSVMALLIFWQVVAWLVANDMIVPYPQEVLLRVVELLAEAKTWNSIAVTMVRVLKGFLISCVCALIFSVLSYSFPKFGILFHPVQLLAKTIPNASYIILALIWLGAEGAVTLVSFMILFPIFYNGFMNALTSQPRSVIDAESLYRDDWIHRIRLYYYPLLKHEFLMTGRTAISMGIKVGVMAEILGQVRVGIGRQLQYARLDLDTSLLFAWTILIILVSMLLDLFFTQFIHRKSREE